MQDTEKGRLGPLYHHGALTFEIGVAFVGRSSSAFLELLIVIMIAHVGHI